MKKFLGLALFSVSVCAHAGDTILTCKIFPAFKDTPKDFNGLDAMYIIENNGMQVKIGPDGDNFLPLTTSSLTYEWQIQANIDGKETVMKESINRVTGAYTMHFFVDGNGHQMSRGQCTKAEPKM